MKLSRSEKKKRVGWWLLQKRLYSKKLLDASTGFVEIARFI